MDQPDQLRELFRMQKSLNERIGVHTEDMTDEQKTEWTLNYCRAMSQELAELTDSVPWKWWAKYQKLDEQNARVEVVDLFHFLISLRVTKARYCVEVGFVLLNGCLLILIILGL